MSGMGQANKFPHTHKGCPDRTVEPNYTTHVRGYIYRHEEQFEKQREKRQNPEADIKNYKYNLGRGINR